MASSFIVHGDGSQAAGFQFSELKGIPIKFLNSALKIINSAQGSLREDYIR